MDDRDIVVLRAYADYGNLADSGVSAKEARRAARNVLAGLEFLKGQTAAQKKFIESVQSERRREAEALGVARRDVHRLRKDLHADIRVPELRARIKELEEKVGFMDRAIEHWMDRAGSAEAQVADLKVQLEHKEAARAGLWKRVRDMGSGEIVREVTDE